MANDPLLEQLLAGTDQRPNAWGQVPTTTTFPIMGTKQGNATPPTVQEMYDPRTGVSGKASPLVTAATTRDPGYATRKADEDRARKEYAAQIMEMKKRRDEEFKRTHGGVDEETYYRKLLDEKLGSGNKDAIVALMMGK